MTTALLSVSVARKWVPWLQAPGTDPPPRDPYWCSQQVWDLSKWRLLFCKKGTEICSLYLWRLRSSRWRCQHSLLLDGTWLLCPHLVEGRGHESSPFDLSLLFHSLFCVVLGINPRAFTCSATSSSHSDHGNSLHVLITSQRPRLHTDAVPLGFNMDFGRNTVIQNQNSPAVTSSCLGLRMEGTPG
jgi:hypothetical protein